MDRERITELAIKNREELTHEIHKAHEAYYSVDHSPCGVSFLEYLAMHLSDAGYTRPAEPSHVARIVSEDGQSGIATGANIPEPNPTSLDEIIPPRDTVDF